jgi:hypothetical protein
MLRPAGTSPMKSARNKPTAAKLRSWRVSIIRKRGQYLGTVEAPNEKAAEAAAVAEFDLSDEQRRAARRAGAKLASSLAARTIEIARVRIGDSQGETPNSFSMSAIIGCVKPPSRRSEKAPTMTRSHSLPSSPETGSPLWAR